jgi:hypothetical protein
MEHLGFEYSRAKDPSWMVTALELTEEEVLERLRKVLKGVTIVSHAVPEYCGDNPPPCCELFYFSRVLFFIYLLLLVLSIFNFLLIPYPLVVL